MLANPDGAEQRGAARAAGGAAAERLGRGGVTWKVTSPKRKQGRYLEGLQGSWGSGRPACGCVIRSDLAVAACETLGKFRFLDRSQPQPCLQSWKSSISRGAGDGSLNFGSTRAGGVAAPGPSTTAGKGFLPLGVIKALLLTKQLGGFCWLFSHRREVSTGWKIPSLCHCLALWPQVNPFPFTLTPSDCKPEPSPFALLQTPVISSATGHRGACSCTHIFRSLEAFCNRAKMSSGGQGKGLSSEDVVSPVLPSPAATTSPRWHFLGGLCGTPSHSHPLSSDPWL